MATYTTTSNTANPSTWRFYTTVGPGQQEPSTARLRERIRDDVADFAMLGCSPGDPPDKIRREWRRLAHLHHPDHGGNRDRFEAIRDAYARLRRNGRA